MNRPRGVLVGLSVALAALAGCGGGGDEGGSSGGGGGGGGGSGVLPNHTVSSTDTSENTARLGNLNAFRNDCGGTALNTVTPHNALIIAAVRHAGWQAIANTGLDHGEPSSNALFSDNSLLERVRKANGGTHLSNPASYSEDIASNSGSDAITLLWNTVYHRIPMMRHMTWRAGYGDQLLAAGDYPTADVPGGNGYATLNWHRQTTPSISLSYWPGAGSVGVPYIFYSNSEGPDPVADRDGVGCPIHVIFPETSGSFTAVNITLIRVSDGSHIPLRVLAGNGSPAGAAGDVATLVGNGYLAPGELFAIPLPDPIDSGLAIGVDYTYNVSVTLSGSNYTTGDVTYTTGP